MRGRESDRHVPSVRPSVRPLHMAFVFVFRPCEGNSEICVLAPPRKKEKEGRGSRVDDEGRSGGVERKMDPSCY